MRVLCRTSFIAIGIFLISTPVSGQVEVTTLGEGWIRTAPIPEHIWGESGRYVIWVQGGWLQVRRETTNGQIDWHIVLATASDPRSPIILAPGNSPKGFSRFEVSYHDGRYFVREDFSVLRVLRERKQGVNEGWPAIELREGRPVKPGSGSCGDAEHPPTLKGAAIEHWFIVSSGPTKERYDCWLRLTPVWRVRQGGGFGFETFASIRRVFAGPNWALDDGELLIATRGSGVDGVSNIAAGKPAPKLLARKLDGKVLNLEECRGKIVLLEFWATWCSPCVAELPRLEELYDTFGMNNKFVMISLSIDDDIQNLRSFVNGRKLPWIHALLDAEDGRKVLRDYGISAIPASFLIGPEGQILAKGMRGNDMKVSVARALEPAVESAPARRVRRKR
jgi:thiol-disulfide isomerase/thioredoxin